MVGEIAAGLLLGPSCFGRLCPELSGRLFDPAAREVFGVLGELGLIFLLFLVGLEFDLGQLRHRVRSAFAISLTGVVLPFALGVTLALAMRPLLKGQALGGTAETMGFVLFLGIAMAITAIPVLARLLLEVNLARTRIGTMTLSAAAVDDACGWILLATISSLVQAEYQIALTVRMIAKVLAFVLVILFVVRPVLRRYVRRTLEQGRGAPGD